MFMSFGNQWSQAPLKTSISRKQHKIISHVNRWFHSIRNTTLSHFSSSILHFPFNISLPVPLYHMLHTSINYESACRVSMIVLTQNYRPTKNQSVHRIFTSTVSASKLWNYWNVTALKDTRLSDGVISKLEWTMPTIWSTWPQDTWTRFCFVYTI